MKKQLENQIKILQEKVYQCTDRLLNNFCHELPWVGEELYNSTYKLEHYKKILFDLNDQTEHEVISYWIKHFTTFISRTYNVRVYSSGTLTSDCSTWAFICNMELLQELNIHLSLTIKS
jgi:hypothetical protein